MSRIPSRRKGSRTSCGRRARVALLICYQWSRDDLKLRPVLGPGVLPAGEVEKLQDDEAVRVAGWPVARQHPHGRDGTVFVTIEDATGDVQVIVWRDLFARRRRELGSQVVEVTGRVSRWDGTTNVIATDLRVIPSGAAMPPSHDWH